MPEPEKQWRPLELIRVTAQYLAQKKIPSARLDAEVLLAAVLHCSRLELFTHGDAPMDAEQVAAYRELVRRRVNREPVSRILGKKEFMGMEFAVTPAVLSPRPETEILVETALKVLDPAPKKKKSEMVFAALDLKMREFVTKQAAGNGATIPAELAAVLEAAPVAPAGEAVVVNPDLPRTPRVLDLGTGSGCIAASLKKLCPRAEVVAVDASPAALAVARANAAALGVEVDFRESDWFSALAGQVFNLIVANPPYIPTDEPLEPEVRDHDPAAALYAGRDGLDAYRQIIATAAPFLAPRGYLIFEVGMGQAEAVSGLIRAAFPAARIEVTPDNAGIDRVILAQI